MGNAESQTSPGKAAAAGGKSPLIAFHPSLELLRRKLKAASTAKNNQSEGDLDIDTLRSVFRLAGDDIHVTHIPPSSPAKSVVGRSPSERFHQAPTPSIGDYFLNYLVAKRKKQSDLFRIDDFVGGCQEILDTLSETNYCAEMYIGYNTSDKDWHLSSVMDEIHLRHMLVTCFYLYQSLHYGATVLTMEDQYLLNSLVISIMSTKKTVSKDDLLSWIYENCSRLFGSTHAWIIRALVDEKGPIHSALDDLCPNVAAPSHLPPEMAFNNNAKPVPSPLRATSPTRPKLSSCSSSASLKSMGSLHSDTILCPMLKWLLSSLLARSYFLSALQDKSEDSPSDPFVDRIKSLSQPVEWTLLFNSNNHGLSMNRFQHHVFAYKGQSVMLVELEAGDVYAIASDAEWKESTSRFGGMDAVLLEAVPRFRCRDSGREILYLNEWGRSLPKGILLGRDHKTPLLKIDSGMDICTAANGMQQNIRAIEVWGCSSGRALDQQQSQKNWEEREANKGRIVSREAAFGGGGRGRGKGARAGWQDNPDRLLLEMGGITTEHNQRSDGC